MANRVSVFCVQILQKLGCTKHKLIVINSNEVKMRLETQRINL
jgi:hypothetical protein